MAAAVGRVTKVPEIRKGDTVIVLAGKDAGKQGKVERVIRRLPSPTRRGGASIDAASPAGGVKVVVEGLNIAKRHTKPRQSPGHERPDAEDPAGRHPRARPADPDRPA